MEDPFGQNFQGSAVANVITGTIFLVLYIIKDRCSHSSCKGTNSCCTYKCKDSNDHGGDEESNCVLEEIKIELQKLHRSQHKSVHADHPSVIQLDDGRERGNPNGRELVEKGRAVQEVHDD